MLPCPEMPTRAIELIAREGVIYGETKEWIYYVGKGEDCRGYSEFVIIFWESREISPGLGSLGSYSSFYLFLFQYLIKKYRLLIGNSYRLVLSLRASVCVNKNGFTANGCIWITDCRCWDQSQKPRSIATGTGSTGALTRFDTEVTYSLTDFLDDYCQ